MAYIHCVAAMLDIGHVIGGHVWAIADAVSMNARRTYGTKVTKGKIVQSKTKLQLAIC